MSELPAGADVTVWLEAPKERTAAYFPTYSHVSKRIQAALRQWTGEWFYGDPDILTRPYTAQSILVYICTHPFRGKRTHTFTYDIQLPEMLELAFTSARCTLRTEIKNLRIEHLDWSLRQVYLPYRSDDIVEYVRRNKRILVKMLGAETALIDAIVNFAVTKKHAIELDAAVLRLTKTVATHLKRFSADVDLENKAGHVLNLATDELSRSLAARAVEKATASSSG